VSKIWLNDARVDYKGPSNLVKLLDFELDLKQEWRVWKFIWARWFERDLIQCLLSYISLKCDHIFSFRY
jgi:hypothetical protein